GEALAASGAIARPDDIFFMTRAEALTALEGDGQAVRFDATDRRATRERQAELVPPSVVGPLHPMTNRTFDALPRMLGAGPADTWVVSGIPASPGRASGPVRVIRGPRDFRDLQPGEVLVAPLTAPAWTPLFILAAAVVTDVGNAAAHASVIAREYGIP